MLRFIPRHGMQKAFLSMYVCSRTCVNTGSQERKSSQPRSEQGLYLTVTFRGCLGQSESIASIQ